MVTKKAKEASMVKFLGSDSTRLGCVCPSQQGDCASTCDAQHKTIESQSKQQCFDSDSILTLQACGFTQDTWTFLSDLHPVSARKSSLAFLSFDKGRKSLLTRSMRPVRAVDYLATLDPSRNVYVTVHRFHGKRCNENLSELTALQLDLDFYDKNSLWAARVEDDPQALVESFHALCRDLDLPVPSLITYSHGLQMLWLLERPVPAEALVRWRLIEKVLVNHFKDYGADSRATDPARVFRLPGTVNSKNGRLCRIVSRVTDETGAVQRYNFEYMSECLLAVGRWECEKHRAPARMRGRTAVRRGTVPAVRSKFFYQHAFDDIVKLIDLRGGIAEGGRMTTLYLMAVAACHAGVVTPETLEAEAVRWAKAIDPDWKGQISALCTVKDRYVRALAGELIDFQGKKVSPLYTPSRRTLIDALDITAEEQKKLKTLCYADLTSQERKNARRRKNTDRNLAAIQKEHQEKVAGVKQLRADGKSAAEIAKALGINTRTVYKYLKEQEAAPASSSVPVKTTGKGNCAARVADARDMRRKGISVPEIARRMRVADRTVQRYLRGMPVPSEGLALPPLPEGERGKKVPDTSLFCGGASRRDRRQASFHRDVSSQRVAPLCPPLSVGGSLLAVEVGNSGGGSGGTACRLAGAVESALPQGGAEGVPSVLGLGKRRFSETRLCEIRAIPLEEAVLRIGGTVKVDKTFKPRKDRATRRFEAQFEGHSWTVVATGMKFVAYSKADAIAVETSSAGGGAIDLAKTISGYEFVSVVTLLSNYISPLESNK